MTIDPFRSPAPNVSVMWKQIDDQGKAHEMSREQVIRDVPPAQQPNKRFTTVEEMGGLTAFLCSDAAASITGTALPVDGSWTAQ